VQRHAHYHLRPVGSVVLALAVAPQALTPRNLEVQRGGVEEHDIQAAEQIPVLSEKGLLNHVLRGPRGEAGGPGLLLFGQHLPQPGHAPGEVMKPQVPGSGNSIAVPPLLAGPVVPRIEEPSLEPLLQHRADPQLLPETAD
jgi:hypothetical protein